MSRRISLSATALHPFLCRSEEGGISVDYDPLQFHLGTAVPLAKRRRGRGKGGPAGTADKSEVRSRSKTVTNICLLRSGAVILYIYFVKTKSNLLWYSLPSKL